MKLRITKNNLASADLRNLRKQVIAKSSISSARLLKSGLHLRGKKIEKTIERSYSTALKDMVSILATKTRLPSNPTMSGVKSVSVKPYGSTTRASTSTPRYAKLSAWSLANHKKYGSGTKVYWQESGWYAKNMARRVGTASTDWRMRQVQFTGVLGVGKKVKMRAKVKAPTFYSTTLNKIIMEPFLAPQMGPVSFAKPAQSIANNVVGRTAYLEKHRPLLSVVMRRHGKEAWKHLKAEGL